MKFLMTYHGEPHATDPGPEYHARIAKFSEDMARSGKVLLTGGMIRPSQGTKLAYYDGEFTVTDGPFAETKELIDGFVLVAVASKEEAIDLARQFMAIAGPGRGEVLQVFDQDLPKP